MADPRSAILTLGLVLTLAGQAPGPGVRSRETATDPPGGRYRINTEEAEFSPAYYGGLAFCAQRGAARWGQADGLALYFLPAPGELRAGGPAPASRRKLTEIPATRPGTDYYTPTKARQRSRTTTAALYSRVRPGRRRRDGNRQNPARLELYTAEVRNGVWLNLRELPLNASDFSCGHPTFSPEDTHLYFASDRPGGFGGTDLYVVQFLNETWGKPRNPGPTVNRRGNEVFPVTDERGNLYFSSDGHPGLGGLDLFFVEMPNGLPHGAVTHPGEPFNSPQDDFGLLTDSERREGFFSSNRRRGDADLYRFVSCVTWRSAVT